jgi:predicted permease
MKTLVQDARYALRTFAAAPGFALAAVLSIALGVGANSSIFSVASALLLRPLPYQDADRLAILWNRSPGLGITEDWFSTAQYFDIRNGSRGFEQVALAIGANANLTGDGEPERVGTVRVSSNLLPMLGARPALGRLFTPEEDREGAAPTAILHHGTWMRRYGGDRGVLERTLILNGASYRVVGVMPPSFSLKREVMPTLGVAADAEVLLPLPLGPKAPDVRGREDYNILAKLAPGVPVAQAQAEMDALTARLRDAHPDVYPPNGGLTFSVVPLQEQVVGDVRRSLLLLAGASGLVLLIACANVANLLLSRAVGRRKEIAVRAAIGASRARVVRQLLTESVLLAVAGGVLGLLLARLSITAIRALGAESVPRLHEIAVDGRVLVFTFAVAVLSGVLFGLAPALRLGRLSLHDTLKDAGRGSAGAGAAWGRGGASRRLLVVAELALSVLVLVTAGLLVRSFARLQDVPPGFNPDHVLTMELTMTGRKYAEPEKVVEAYRDIGRRLASLPGVTATGAISSLPLSQMMAWGPITVEGRIPPPGEKFINVDQRIVSGEYFQAMQIPLAQGRFFDSRDVRAGDRVAIADELMARQLWPESDPIGKRVRIGSVDSTSPWITIVGVAGRIKQDALDSESRMALYFPHAQFTTRSMNLVVRGAGDPAALAPTVRAQLREMDPDLPVYNVRTMRERVEASLARRRFAMLLLAAFAVLALGLATVGVYSVMAYLVSQGTREIGIRMALGATPRGMLLLVVRHAAIVVVLGLTAGVAGALVTTRFLRTMLYGIDARDPATFVAIVLGLAAIALAASVVPARRAAHVDPMVALRSE